MQNPVSVTRCTDINVAL